MLKNIHIHQQRTVHVPYEKTVHEHRAPTDDSIRLYKEMVEKAEEEVLGRIEIKNNLVEAVVFWYQPQAICSLRFCCRFKINGEIFTITHEVDRPLSQCCYPEIKPAVDELYEAMSKQIALILLDKHVSESFRGVIKLGND